ncbi:nucleoside-diphosphate-sugar epimerase [Chryseobacterium sp. H1D6B]|uniref:SDR family oxidoreductase n=1 Tax=Chryseobacterium sp. H1D6B TaxID=2940588 RepID=UPI0015CB4762|nr:aldehyde reductase [Chryseobacterium sp. H1D6B]MDH6250614.1 nucleoside-diphosphate-sugar epimerase [Chryseobacterium sp. H1D6B]
MKNLNITVLVTGGTGFLGAHCILQLLQQGYKVKTTIRTSSKKDKVLNMLKNGGIQHFENLSFIEADLTQDKNWDTAVENCDYVLHVASPIHLKLPKHENEMIFPAVQGTLRVLNAAKKAQVKRVVMTSNFGAVGYSVKNSNEPITEKNWTDPNEKGLSAYNKSKIMAEKAAWDFMKNDGGDMELSVINPVGIFGPALDKDLSSGFELLKRMIDGNLKAVPKLVLGIVDVRDAADLHLKAMTDPKAAGERFLALSDGTFSLPQIAALLRKKMPEISGKISTKVLPDWLVKLTALFNENAKTIAPMLGINRNASNEKAKTHLGWKPRTKEEAVLETVKSMIYFKNI